MPNPAAAIINLGRESSLPHSHLSFRSERHRAAAICRAMAVAWAIPFLLCFVSAGAFGQTAGTGAIAGVVTDSSGALIEGVLIAVTDKASGKTRTAVSETHGNYSVPLLPPGDYTMDASRTGFKKANFPNITVSVTQTETLNITLQVGATQETVQVNAVAEQLQTETSALGRVTDGQMVESLPLAVRNYTQIIGLSSGVASNVTNAAELGRGGGSNGSDSFVAAGGSNNDNNFQMNGVEIDDFQSSGGFSGGVAVPNPDAIEEFKVQTGQYDASYGRDAGANVNVVTKGGTNSYHGTLFEFFRNDALNANEWFRNELGQPRQVLRQNQYGMTFGGPIVKNKLLFFTSYQGTRQTNGVDSSCSTTFNTPPLTNDRSQAALGALFYGQPTYIQEATGLPLGPSIAQDGSNISSQALALLQLKLPNGQYMIPTPQKIDPTQPFDSQGLYAVSIPCPFYEEQFMTNADWNQSQRTQWQVRFFFANSSQQLTLPPSNLTGTSGGAGFPYSTKQHFRNFSLTNTHSFGTNLLNQAEIAYHRQLSNSQQGELFSYSQIGVTAPSFDNNIPSIYASGLAPLGGNGQGVFLIQNTYVVQDTLAWQKGKHSIRFGGGVTRAQDNLDDFHFYAGLYFLTVPDFLLGQAGTPYGLPFGNVYGSLDNPGIFGREYRLWDGNAYVQDDYKVTSRLTLNLGLRFERMGDVTDKLGRNANFNINAANPNPPASGSLQGFLVASNYSGPTLPTGVTKSDNNWVIAGDGQNTWNPRVGFAWRVPGSDKVVLRGGYGEFHQHLTGQLFIQLIASQPWAISRSQFGTDPDVTFADPFEFPGQSAALPQFTPYSPSTQLSGWTFAQNYRPPVIHRYSLNTQTEITKDILFEIGYVGARGLHLLRTILPNQALDATVSPVRGQTDNTLANLNERLPLIGWSSSQLNQIDSEGASWYNALEASFTKRFSHGLQFLASYTWARELSTEYAASTSAFGGEAVGNQYDARARYGPDQFIRPQRFVVSYVYEPPFFKQRGAFLRNTLGGWKIAGVTTIQSGHLLGVLNTNVYNVFGINGYEQDFAQLAPNCTLQQVNTSGSIQHKLGNYINQSCFTNPTVVSADGGTAFGNTRPGIVHGPAQNNTDLSFIKNFALRWPSEKAGIEFRGEMFNAFNHPQFRDPINAFDNPSFGQVQNTSVAPRIVQFALKVSF